VTAGHDTRADIVTENAISGLSGSPAVGRFSDATPLDVIDPRGCFEGRRELGERVLSVNDVVEFGEAAEAVGAEAPNASRRR
jgi:hypothetical protein